MFRDDDAAREELVAALERDQKRLILLEDRVRELELENHRLREGLLAERAAPSPIEPALGDIYVDEKLEQYIELLITGSRDPRRSDRILSGALPIDATRIVARARELAAAEGRKYATPTDVKGAARELLPGRLIMRRGSPDSVVEELLDQIAVP